MYKGVFFEISLIFSFSLFFKSKLVSFTIILSFFSTPAIAEVNSGDTAWILTSTALVLFMTLPGLALFYGGLVSSKNIVSVLMEHFALACVVSIIWVVAGYSLAFSAGNDWIGGLSNIFMNSINVDSVSGTIPESLFATFQMTFAIITPALVVGAFAERVKFGPICVFSVLWVLIVYVPVTHWVWGGGWLAQMGVMDFAGGLVVHTTAGISALVTSQNARATRRISKEAARSSPPSDGYDRRFHALGWLVWFQCR